MPKDLWSTKTDPRDVSDIYLCIRSSDVSTGLRRTIQEAFHKCEKYLDPDFADQFKRRDSFYQRLWELCICERLLDTDVQFLSRPRRNEPGADFALCLDDKVHIRIECVCPNDAKNSKDKCDYNTSIKCEIEKKEQIYSIVQSGVDDYIISRYTNALAEKGKIFKEKYKYPEYDIKILLVLGEILEKIKGQKYGIPDRSSLCTFQEFKTAIAGQQISYFEKDKGSYGERYDYYKFFKPTTNILINTNDELLKEFDFIIFSPSIFRCTQQFYTFLLTDKKLDEKLYKFIKKAFPP